MSTTGMLPGAADPHVFLIGPPPIGEFLGFIRTMAVDGQTVDLGGLTAEWRSANDHVLQLEKDEAGAPDNPPITALPASTTRSQKQSPQILFTNVLTVSCQQISQ
jgi:hypothetical protein